MLNLITYSISLSFIDSAAQSLVFIVIGILFIWFGLTADIYTYHDDVLGLHVILWRDKYIKSA